MFLDRIVQKLDIYCAILGFFFGIASLFMFFLKSQTILILIIGVVLTIISPVYLYFRLFKKESRIFSKKNFTDETPLFSSRINKIASFVYWICCIVAVLVLIAVPNTRHPAFFLLIALAVGSLTISILCVKNTVSRIFQIIKIIYLGFLIRFSRLLFFAGSGVDYWTHLYMNEQIVDYGSLFLSWGKEVSYPIMHIQAVIGDLFCNLPMKEATIVGVSIPLTIATVICVYIFASKLFSKKIGLISALFLVLCDYCILWSTDPQTTSFGLCLFLIVMICIINIWKKYNKGVWIFLFAFLSLILLLIHAVSSYVLAATLVAFMLGSIIWHSITNTRISTANDKNIFLAIIFGILLLLQSFYAAYSEKTHFLEQILSTLVSTSENASLFNRADNLLINSGLSESILFQFIDNCGFLILFILAVFSFYLWLHKKNQSKELFCILSAFIVLQFITYIFPLVGLRNILPTRWFAFFYFFFAIMAACSIVVLFSRKKKIAIFIPIIVMIFALLMVSGSVANLDSPLYSKEYRVSTTYTFSENEAAHTLASYIDTNKQIINTDYRYISLFNNIRSKMFSTDENNEFDLGSLVVWREYLNSRPTEGLWKSNNYYKEISVKIVLGTEYGQKFNRLDKVYSIGTVFGYYV